MVHECCLLQFLVPPSQNSCSTTVRHRRHDMAAGVSKLAGVFPFPQIRAGNTTVQVRQGQVVRQQYVLRPKSCESAIAESLRSASCSSCFNDHNSLSQEHTMAAKPWTRLESHQSTSAISSCCFEEVPNKQRTSSALSDFYVNTFGRALIDNIGKAFVSCPMR